MDIGPHLKSPRLLPAALWSPYTMSGSAPLQVSQAKTFLSCRSPGHPPSHPLKNSLSAVGCRPDVWTFPGWDRKRKHCAQDSVSRPLELMR